MDVLLDKILVIDVEATCWQGDPPLGQEKEIIEIGICLIDIKDLKRIDMSKRGIIVRPEKSTVSDYCVQLVNLTQDQVEKGILLKEACEILKKEYLSNKRTWASWGAYDRRKFEEECRSKKIGYPFSSRHINVKNLFAVAMGLKHEVDLSEAMQMINCPFVGRVHRAADDTYNIALILDKLLLRAREKTN